MSVQSALESLRQSPPTTGEIIKISLATFVLYYLATTIYDVFFGPLSAIPGPFLARWTGLWSQILYFRRTRFYHTHTAHEKYGPIIRTGPNMIEVTGLENLDKVYGAKLDKPSSIPVFDSGEGDRRSSHVYAIAPPFGDGNLTTLLRVYSFSCKTVAEAQGKRRSVLPHFSVANVITWQPVIQDHVRSGLFTVVVSG